MPKPAIAAAAFALMIAASAAANAQPQAAPPPGPGAMGGHGPGMGMGPRWGRQNTYGWSMMTATERQEHLARMRSFKTYAECHAYVSRHHRLMARRARQRGVTMPAEPRSDVCAGLR